MLTLRLLRLNQVSVYFFLLLTFFLYFIYLVIPMQIRWSCNSCPSDAIMSILGNLFLSMRERCSREVFEAFFPLKFRNIFLDCSDASVAVSRWRSLIYRPYLDINDLIFGHTAGIDNVYSKLMLEFFFQFRKHFQHLWIRITIQNVSSLWFSPAHLSMRRSFSWFWKKKSGFSYSWQKSIVLVNCNPTKHCHYQLWTCC
jgi:hypothetical protein